MKITPPQNNQQKWFSGFPASLIAVSMVITTLLQIAGNVSGVGSFYITLCKEYHITFCPPQPNNRQFGNSSQEYAQNSTDRFYFDTVKGIPATFVKTLNGEFEFIHWDSKYVEPSGDSPEKRGREVTARLNRYFANNNEVYITHGKMNNQPVVCVAEKERGSCTGLLYTLKPYQDGEKAVGLLIRQLERPNAASPLRL